MPTSGPIVRTGATPEFWKNWENVFGDGAAKKSGAKSSKKKAASKATSKTAKSAGKKKTKRTAKK